jgi:hypothetical protein
MALAWAIFAVLMAALAWLWSAAHRLWTRPAATLPAWLKAAAKSTWLTARRAVILLIGSSVVIVGVAMIVLPGPAFVVIPLGLAILATEFVWAKRLLDKAKAQVQNTVNHLRGSTPPTGGGAPPHEQP